MQRHAWKVLAAALVAATAAAQDDEGTGPAEGFKQRRDEEIPTTPDGLDARYEGAVKARSRGEVDRAIGFYEQILKTDPKALSVHIAMGTAHWEKGELPAAEKWLQSALEINARQIKARQFLGQLRMQSGRFAEATVTFGELLDLDKNLADVVASGHLNLARIALVKRKWADAEKHFKEVGKSPEPGDRASAEKGLKLLSRLRKTVYWNREQTPLLDVHFAPGVEQAGDSAWRKTWVGRREAALRKIYDGVKWSIPEAIPVYVHKNDGEAWEISDMETTRTIRYSWWLVHTLADSTPGRDLAVQVVSRAWGSRPASLPLVDGFCSWLDGAPKDRHAAAKALKKAGKLRDLAELHRNQRELDGMYEASESFVAAMIEEFGLEKWIASFRNYNIVMLNPDWKKSGTGVFRWQDALSEVFRRGLGVDYAKADSVWRRRLE